MNAELAALFQARRRRAWRRRGRAAAWFFLGVLGGWIVLSTVRSSESPAATPPVSVPAWQLHEEAREQGGLPVRMARFPETPTATPSVFIPVWEIPEGRREGEQLPSVQMSEQSLLEPHVQEGEGKERRVRLRQPRVFHSFLPQDRSIEEPKVVPEAPARIEDFVIGAILESTLPEAVRIFNRRLESALDLIDEERLTREYSEDELNQILLSPLQARYAQQLGPLTAQIHPDGLWISGTVRVGREYIPLEIRMGVEVVRGRIHLAMNEFAVNGRPIPSAMREDLERRVNDLIDRERTAIRIRDFVLGEGWVRIALDLK